MKLTKIAGDCPDGPCPAVHAIEGGEDVVVQLYEITDSAVLDQLDVPPGELVGRLPARLILDAAASLQGERDASG